MAITLQRSGVGTIAYPFYLADTVGDLTDVSLLPVPTDSDATLFVLDTRQTYVWRGNQWVLYDDRQATALAAIRQAVEAAPARYGLLILRELRSITLLLAQAQGIPATAYDPLPE